MLPMMTWAPMNECAGASLLSTDLNARKQSTEGFTSWRVVVNMRHGASLYDTSYSSIELACGIEM